MPNMIAKLASTALALTALLAGTAPAAAQGVGSQMPDLDLRDFAQTEATSLDDFYGRAVLLEFFAYW